MPDTNGTNENESNLAMDGAEPPERLTVSFVRQFVSIRVTSCCCSCVVSRSSLRAARQLRKANGSRRRARSPYVRRMEIDPMESAERRDGEHSRLNCVGRDHRRAARDVHGHLQGQGRQHRSGHAAGAGRQDRSLELLPGAQHPSGDRAGGARAADRSRAPPRRRRNDRPSIRRSPATRRSSPIRPRRRTRCAFRPRRIRRPTTRSTIATISSICPTR